MTVCDFCKKEISSMHAGRQLGPIFIHQECYNIVVVKLEDSLLLWAFEVEEKIELEANQSGSADEIVLIIS